MLLRMREQVCDHHHHHHQLPDLSSPVLTSQGSASAFEVQNWELLEEFVNQTAGQAFNRLMAGLRGSALGLFCKWPDALLH